MSLLQTVQFIADQTYYDEDGELAEFQATLPERYLPPEVREQKDFFGRTIPGKYGRRKSLLERLLDRLFGGG